VNLLPLLAILHRISHGRILEDCALSSEGDFHQAVFPIVDILTGGEAEEPTLRSYAADWVVKASVLPLRAKCTFARLQHPKPWKYDDGRQDPRRVLATLTLSWWPRPPALEEWSKQKPRDQAA
jgi:hypothetical protein